MKPAPFAYHAPDSLAVALALASEHGDDALPLAGGQSLVPMLNLRLAFADHIIDLNGVDELRHTRRDGSDLVIGAMVRHAEAQRSADVRGSAPLFAFALPHVAYPAIRVRGTLGGSVANADPKAELPCALLASGGAVMLRSATSERCVSAEDFFLGPYTTAREPDELVVAIRIPVPRERSVCGFAEVARSHGEFALSIVAVRIESAPDGTCTDVRIAVGGACGHPTRARVAETALVGRALDPPTIAEVSDLVAGDIEPLGDGHGSAGYRLRITAAVTRRALEQAAGGMG